MNIALLLLQYGLGLLPSIVLGVQTLAGDVTSGKDKLTMAQDMLGVALQGASSVLPAGTNSTLATLAAQTVGTIIKATGAIDRAVSHTKATGEYQAATTAFTTNQAAIAAATVAQPKAA